MNLIKLKNLDFNIIQSTNIDLIDTNNKYSLFYACEHENEKFVRYLLD